MSFRDCLIVERTTDWFIVVGSETERLAADVSVEELVTCVNLMIKLAGLKTPNCMIAPASTSCFFTTIKTAAELDIRDRNALVYELESHIPLDAETMVADFVVTVASTKRGEDPNQVRDVNEPATADASLAERGKTLSAIAVEFPRWQVLAEALETSGIPVRSIVPSSALATRAVCNEFKLSGPVELLLVDGTHCDAVTIENESISAWKHLVFDAETLRQHRLLDSGKIAQVVVLGADESQRGQVRDVYDDAALQSIDRPLESFWIDGTSLSLSKQSSRWFDLRRDQLGPSDPLRPIQPHLRLVTAAAILCLLSVAIGGWWRSRRIESAIDRLNAQQRAAFEDAFPGSPVPAALVRRVRSEHTKVLGSRGATAEIEVPQSATEVLQELLAALPNSVRFRIKSLKILNGRVDLELQVRTTVDAGVLATALESHGFEVEPPVTTRKDAQTFDSSLEARWTGRTPDSTATESPQAVTTPRSRAPLQLTLIEREVAL